MSGSADILQQLLPELKHDSDADQNQILASATTRLLAPLQRFAELQPIDHRAYLAHVVERLPDDPAIASAAQLAAALDALCVDDLALAWACAQGSNEAIDELQRRTFDVIDGALSKMEDLGSTAEEVKQRLRDRLLVGDAEGQAPRILQYAGRGDLRSWIRIAAVREALGWWRKARRQVPLSDDHLGQLAQGGEDPELEYLKQHYRAEFSVAFEKALAALDHKQRNLLRYCYFDRLSIDEIGALFGVHRATAARWLQRTRELLLETTREELRRDLAVEQQELDSIMRLIRSQLDASIRRFLNQSGD